MRVLNTIFYYFLYIFIYWWLSIILFPVKMLGKRAKFRKGSIFVSNHISFMDPMIHYFFYPLRPMIIVKKELEKSRVGWLLPTFNAFGIERGASDIKGLRRILGGLKKGGRLLIFPEGTRRRNDDGDMGEIRTGTALFAIRAKAPLTPMMIHHKSGLFKRNFVMCGETFELSEFYELKPTPEVLKQASDIISAKMKDTKDKLDAEVARRYGKRKWYKRLMAERDAEHAEAAIGEKS